ncbi:iron-containing alcohol dehydrogenase [Solidesulfovibrio fructosivorans JJ]]|uniref:Iron-containing alcohol dehydrogenase n=1 Tax=Solidesulfovibrio fructosivorans JJ] TaxID=596151 RepID=E1K2H1_SOLFR|nr:iron-containing alcohol dehydrogenase [Solidesulfovibrio fructosivorans]EFL49189.1 iron-containing alcohol dehydrogenase [Solidesulfovibrio fructosivorans JJ]]
MHQEIFATTPRIILGTGTIARVGEEVRRLGKTSVCIITDPGVAASGIVERVEGLLDAAGLAHVRFDKVEADPRYEIVEDALAAAKGAKADCIIGIGGGSSLDMAKITAVMAVNEGPVGKYFGTDLIPVPGLKTILIPTTAGTGSEVTPIVILSDHHEKLKKGIVSPYIFPAVALLDAELTIGLPPKVTAPTGMDALIHALEAYTSINATPMTDLLAKEAIHLIYNNIRAAYAKGDNLPARENMLRGAMLAGMAFANAGVTAVHAFAYPIGAEFHIPHGIANTIMLVPVMRFNQTGNLGRFAELAAFLGQPVAGLSLRQAAASAVTALTELAEDLAVPQHLAAYGVTEEHVPTLAASVMLVTRLLANNPRHMTQEDAEVIYRQAL